MEISLNKATIPSNCKKNHSASYLQRGDRSAITKYRLISLTYVVCKQLEHLIAG